MQENRILDIKYYYPRGVKIDWLGCDVCAEDKNLMFCAKRLTTLNLSRLYLLLIIFQGAASTTESGKKSKKRDKKKGKTAKQKLHGFFF